MDSCPSANERCLSLDEVRQAILTHEAEIRAFGVSSLGICGSVSRREATPESDLDLVVEMDLSLETLPFRRYFGLIAFIEELLRRDVDLLTRNEIKPYARESIERDLIPVGLTQLNASDSVDAPGIVGWRLGRSPAWRRTN